MSEYDSAAVLNTDAETKGHNASLNSVNKSLTTVNAFFC